MGPWESRDMATSGERSARDGLKRGLTRKCPNCGEDICEWTDGCCNCDLVRLVNPSEPWDCDPNNETAGLIKIAVFVRVARQQPTSNDATRAAG